MNGRDGFRGLYRGGLRRTNRGRGREAGLGMNLRRDDIDNLPFRMRPDDDRRHDRRVSPPRDRDRMNYRNDRQAYFDDLSDQMSSDDDRRDVRPPSPRGYRNPRYRNPPRAEIDDLPDNDRGQSPPRDRWWNEDRIREANIYRARRLNSYSPERWNSDDEYNFFERNRRRNHARFLNRGRRRGNNDGLYRNVPQDYQEGPSNRRRDEVRDHREQEPVKKEPAKKVIKEKLPHHSQRFAERPEGSTFQRKNIGTKIEVLTNHVLVRLNENPVTLHSYYIECYNERGAPLHKNADFAEHFFSMCEMNGQQFPPKYLYVFVDSNTIWTTDLLPEREGTVNHKKNNSTLEYKYLDSFLIDDHLGGNIGNVIKKIATARCRSDLEGTSFLNSFIFTTNGTRKYCNEAIKYPLTIPLRHGIDTRLWISMEVQSGLRAGITASFDAGHLMVTRPYHPTVLLLCEILNNGSVSREDFVRTWSSAIRRTHLTQENRSQLLAIVRKMRLRYALENAIRIRVEGEDTVPSFFESRFERGVFDVYDITTTSADDTMYEEYGNTSVTNYYLENKIRLRYPNLPCFIKRIRVRDEFVLLPYPMEFVTYSKKPKRFEGHRSEQLLSEYSQNTKADPQMRLTLLQRVVGQEKTIDVPLVVDNQDNYMKHTGLKFEKDLVTVKATILPAPTVVYGEGSKFEDTKHTGEWEAVSNVPVRKILEGAEFVRNKKKNAPKKVKRLIGSVLFVGSEGDDHIHGPYDLSGYNRLMSVVASTGQPIVWEDEQQTTPATQYVSSYIQGPSNIGIVEDFFERLKRSADSKSTEKEKHIPLCFVVYGTMCLDRQTNHYNMIKYLAESRIGIHIQPMLIGTLREIQENQNEWEITSSIAEKILAKIGTTHRKLVRNGHHKSWTKLTNPESPTLVLGINVWHPTTKDIVCERIHDWSVATVVGNIDLDCADYRSSSKTGIFGIGEIIDIKKEVRERLMGFIENNDGLRPAHIVVYRNYLEENDFQRVLYEERLAIEEACISLGDGYQPTITYIAVETTHKTQFFFEEKAIGFRNQVYNIPPGTLVEHKVTSDKYFDFFLQSQKGDESRISRPTRYYVLYDSWNPLVSFWPTVTHALCYLCCRDTRSMSVPAPLVYANLASKQRKECIDGAWGCARIKDLPLSDWELQKAVQSHEDLDGLLFL